MELDNSIILSSSNLEPTNEIEFETHESAYDYYKEYAKSEGFGTAKLSSRRSRASKEFIDAKFSCIRYGNKQQSDDAVNPRPSPKIGCKASMHVKRKANGKWYVHSFVKEHNHELLPAQAHFFRSHRNVDSVSIDSKGRKKKGLLKQNGGQSSVTLESVMRNQHDRGRFLRLEEGGHQIVLEFCSHMHEENPKFFYALDFNEEHRLRNVFWVDGKGVEDFKYFGDVVSVETSYFVNKYKIPLVLFIGVNHHIQPTLLGCALIADETFYTFAWLMQSWRLAMNGCSPGTILTGQNEGIKAAIRLVFPETQHYFHLWHILERIPKRLDYLSIWHETFMKKLNKCIHRSYSEERFEKRWWKLIERFNLREDEWFLSLYNERKLWVPALLNDVSLADLCTASRSESLNAFFDQYIHKETSLRDWLGQYDSILEERYEEEAKANFDAWHETPDLMSPSPFEKQMLLVYTHEIFKKFQIEVLGAAACHLKKEDGSDVLYTVKDFQNNKEFKVKWDDIKSNISCSCRLFEYEGYLCRHAIVVLQMSGVFSIPVKYVLKRWTNAATSRFPLNEKMDETQAKIRRYNDLCRRAIILGEEGSLSEDSYNNAVAAIHQAVRQCGKSSNPLENDTRASTSTPLAILGMTSVNHDGNTAVRGQISKSKAITIKGSKRANSSKEPSYSGKTPTKKGKVPLEPQVSNVGPQGMFQQMEMSRNLDYPTLYPRFLTTLLKGGEMSKRSVELLGEMLEEQS